MRWRGTLLILLTAAAAEGADRHNSEALRRPLALAVAGDNLYVANHRSGSVSVIDIDDASVVGEWQIGNQLSDLTTTADGKFLLAVDKARHELLLLRAATEVTVLDRISVARYPVDVTLWDDRSLISVASLWSQRLTLVRLDRDSKRFTLLKTIDLPFAPRQQLAIDGGKRLVVADAFAGRLGVVDVETGRLRAVRSFAGHNIGGIALTGPDGDVLLTHQILNSDQSTTHEGVFWGGVIRNVARTIPGELLTAEVGDGERPLETPPGSLDFLGSPGNATGDPAELVVVPDGPTVIALAGVNELAARRKPTSPFSRHSVGRRPTALALDAKRSCVYVANTFDDSISIFDLNQQKVVGTISLGPTPALTPADRGEMLFYDARLSLDGWYSCHSCHTDGHSNSKLNDNLGDDYYGDPKRVLSLRGVGETGPWAWNGRRESLAEQIEKSITVTMQGEKPGAETIAALGAYLRTLSPVPGIDAARQKINDRAVELGRRIFEREGCSTCHQANVYTTPEVYDVSLHDRRGTKEFNPPSLRGVSQGGPYFHDGRAQQLRDVFEHFEHGLSGKPTERELEGLLKFLRSL